MSSSQIIDLSILAVYLVFTAFIGIWVGRRESGSAKGYFLGNKKFTWWMIGGSVFATNISSHQITAQSGDAYRAGVGIAAANPQLMGGVMIGLSALFFIPIYVRSGIFTIPQFLELRYNRTAKIFFSLIFVLQGFLLTPIGIYTGSLAIVEFFGLGQENLWMVALAMGATVGVYAVMGGLMSVVVTDVLQVSLLIIGGLLVVGFGFARIDDLGHFWSTLEETHLELVLPWKAERFPWQAVVSGLALGGLIWSTSNAGLLQRVLGAKNELHAQGGMMFAGFLKISALVIIVFPGVIAAYLFPGQEAEGVYAVMVREMLPVGLSGLVLAALLAALMSSQDSGVCSVSSIVALDLYPLFDKNTTEEKALKVGKIAAATMLILGVLAAPLMGNVGSVYRYFLMLGAYLTFPVGVCYIAGRFLKFVNAKGAVTVMSIGVPLGLFSILMETFPSLKAYAPDFVVEQHFHLVSTIYAGFYLVILIVVSLLTGKPAPEKTQFIEDAARSLREEAKGRPLYLRMGFWYAILLGCLVGLYILF